MATHTSGAAHAILALAAAAVLGIGSAGAAPAQADVQEPMKSILAGTAIARSGASSDREAGQGDAQQLARESLRGRPVQADTDRKLASGDPVWKKIRAARLLAGRGDAQALAQRVLLGPLGPLPSGS